MLSRDHVLARLRADMGGYTRSLRKIAMYIIDHPAAFGMNSIRQTARAAGVSTNSLVRLADALDFASYHDLRQPFRESLTAQASTSDAQRWIADLYERDGGARIQAMTAASAIGNVTEAMRETPIADIEQAADLLLTGERVYLLGMRAPFALVHYFYYVGRMALPNLIIAPRHANIPADDILTAGPGDVIFAISMSPFSRETIAACKLANQCGARLIMLTDSAAEMLPFKPDVMLVTPMTTAHYFKSFLGAHALLEWLLTVIEDRGGAAVAERLARFQALRDDLEVYWRDG